MLDKKTFAIGVLAITAVMLLIGNMLSSDRAAASTGVVAGNKGYQVVTAHITSGGDALYMMDNNTGTVAVFTFDSQQRRMVPRVVSNISTAFPMGNNAGGAVAPGRVEA